MPYQKCPCGQPVAQTLWIEAVLGFPADGGAPNGPLVKVASDLGAAAQQVAEHGIYVREPQGRVLLYDFLRRGAPVEGLGDRVQRYPRARNPDDLGSEFSLL